jgi:hypothetical protein
MVPQFLKGEEETLVRVTPFPIKGVRFPHEGAPFPAWVHRFLTEGASIPKRVARFPAGGGRFLTDGASIPKRVVGFGLRLRAHRHASAFQSAERTSA